MKTDNEIIQEILNRTSKWTKLKVRISMWFEMLMWRIKNGKQ